MPAKMRILSAKQVEFLKGGALGANRGYELPAVGGGIKLGPTIS